MDLQTREMWFNDLRERGPDPDPDPASASFLVGEFTILVKLMLSLQCLYSSSERKRE